MEKNLFTTDREPMTDPRKHQQSPVWWTMSFTRVTHWSVGKGPVTGTEVTQCSVLQPHKSSPATVTAHESWKSVSQLISAFPGSRHEAWRPLILGVHLVKGKTQLPQAILWHLQNTHTHTNKYNFRLLSIPLMGYSVSKVLMAQVWGPEFWSLAPT